MSDRSRARRSSAAAAAGLALLLLARFGPMLASAGTSFADFEALHGQQLLNEVADSRLNAWILSWVQHAAFSEPLSIYDANAFHPAPASLTGSEHLFGVALQVLPFRALTTNAVALYQIALVLSSLLLAWSTFACVRWATASAWAAFLAAALAIMMPWRVTELSHLQLSSVQLVPAVWMLVARGLLDGLRRREIVLLGVCTALQLLSSFYLAYYLSLSGAILAACAILIVRPAWRRIARVAMAVAPAYVLFGLSAIPYLRRQASADLETAFDPSFSLGVVGALSLLWPRWPFGGELLNAAANYNLPAAGLVLALLGLAAARPNAVMRPNTAASGAALRMRVLALSLGAVAALGFVLMIGGKVDVAGLEVPLPAWWLSELVPGFSLLRGPARWGILVGICVPILAGIGIAVVEDAWRARATSARSFWIPRAVVALALAASLDWFAIPTRPVWKDPAAIARRYAVVQSLEFAPVLEVPWSSGLMNAEHASLDLLESTLHWRPLVNGYTGHLPATYRFLQRLADRLPGATALVQLTRLTGVRWIVLDPQALRPATLARWESAARRGDLELVFRDPATRIYRVRALERAARRGSDMEPARPGDWMQALIATEPRPLTFAGHSRAALALEPDAGTLAADPVRVQFGDLWNPLVLSISNRSRSVWPGFDSQREGLVQLRYTYRDATSGEVTTRLAALGADFRPGSRTSAVALLRPPLAPGPHRLCLDLVQQLGEELRRLPVPSLQRQVEIRERDDPSGLARLLAGFYREPPALPPCLETSEPGLDGVSARSP